MDRQTGWLTCRKKSTDKQTDGEASRQTDRQTDRQTEIWVVSSFLFINLSAVNYSLSHPCHIVSGSKAQAQSL